MASAEVKVTVSRPSVLRYITKHDPLPEGKLIFNPIVKRVTRVAWKPELFAFDHRAKYVDNNPGQVFVFIDQDGYPSFVTESAWKTSLRSSSFSCSSEKLGISGRSSTISGQVIDGKLTIDQSNGATGYCMAFDKAQTQALFAYLCSVLDKTEPVAQSEDNCCNKPSPEKEKDVCIDSVPGLKTALEALEPLYQYLRKAYIEQSKKKFVDIFTN